jgi:hypothetical protein
MIDINGQIDSERKEKTMSPENVIHCYYDYFLFIILFLTLLILRHIHSQYIHPRARKRR